MKTKILLLCIVTLCCIGAKGQTWTWTGETPAAGSYYLYTVNQGKFLNDNNGLDAIPTILWTIGGTFPSNYTLTSSNSRQFSMYRSGSIINYSYNVVTNATGKSGNDVNLSSALQDGKYSIYRNSTSGWSGARNVVSTNTGITRQSDASYEWYYITDSQVNNYNEYTSSYRLANTLNPSAVAAGDYATANNLNASTKIAGLKKIISDYLASATLDAPVDVTSLIVNPGFEASTWNEGWTVDGFGEHGNDGKFVGSHIAEMWSADLVSGSVKQELTNLPNGVYILKAKIAAGFDGSEQYMYAKTTAETRKAYVAGKDGDPAEYHEVMFRVLPGDNGQAEIGFSRENIRWWTAVDDWSLEYIGETPAFTYEMGTRLDGSYLSRPAYTSTPADGVDPDHANDGLLVVTWPDEATNDPWSTSTLEGGAKAHVTADGVDIYVDLLSHFRSSTYHNGFGLYIPDFDENKTYTVIVPANVLGYASGNAEAFGKTFTKVMNEEFTINAKQSPIKDGKYFIRVAGTSKHVSRGGHYGTQAVLDNYGVPVLVQTAGLTVFKFLDNNAFFGNDHGADDMYTDCFDERTRRYNLIPDDEENPTKVQFFTPARNKYLYHANDAINGVTYEKMSEGDEGDWYDFEPFTAEGYAAHLHGIDDAEAQRVAERAGLAVATREEYNTLIDDLETAGATTVWPAADNEDETSKSASYHEARNNDLPVEPVWEPAPKDLIAGGERLTLTLNKGLYCVSLNAFQQASALAGLQQNLGFRGLVYYYAKVGDVMSKDQLKSITETTGAIPTTEEEAKAALTGTNYRSRIIFYVPADNTQVEFGVQNPQRLGNGIDATADSWVAFQNLVIERFAALDEATLSVKAEKYGTFVAPFMVKLPEGIKAFNCSSVSGGFAIASEIEGEYVAAATPVILKNTTAAPITETYRGVGTNEETVSDGFLVGFYQSGISIPTGSYVLQTQNGEQAFYEVGEDRPMTGTKNRCYLTTASQHGASLRIAFNGSISTSISFDELSEDVARENAEYYSVNGTKLSAPQKGLSIVKMGNIVKKVFIK